MASLCSHSGCSSRAVVQLTYDYATSRAFVASLGDVAAPNTYALCQSHIDKLKVPRGWELIREDEPKAAPLSVSAIDNLAAAVRRAGGITADAEAEGTEHTLSGRDNLITLNRRAHLRVVADAASHGAAIG